MFERFIEDTGAGKTSLFEVFSACLGRNVLMQKTRRRASRNG